MDVEIDYTNHSGERRWRRVRPIRLEYAESAWHPGKQWIMRALCLEKDKYREFAMTGIHGWRPVTPD